MFFYSLCHLAGTPWNTLVETCDLGANATPFYLLFQYNVFVCLHPDIDESLSLFIITNMFLLSAVCATNGIGMFAIPNDCTQFIRCDAFGNEFTQACSFLCFTNYIFNIIII